MADNQQVLPEEDQLYQQSLEGRTMMEMPLPSEQEGEGVVASVNLEPEFTEEELSAPLDVFSTGPVQTFEKQAEEQVAPASLAQLEGTAEIVNSLGLSSRYASMDDMRRAFNEEVWGTPIDEVITNLMSAEGPARQAQAMAALNRTDLSVEDRLNLVRSIASQARVPDMNMIERKRLQVEAQNEYAGQYDDEAEAGYAQALEAVSSIPRLAVAEAAPEAEVSQDELRAAYEEFLTLQIEEADSRTGVVNFLPNLLPFYGSIPIGRILKRFNDMLPEDERVLANNAGYLMNGSALRLMREKIETLPLEKKIEVLGEVLRVLKPNGSLMHHENAHITLYTLQSLFYKDAFGEDFIKQASDETNKAYIHALAEADKARRYLGHEKDPERRRALEQAENDWFAEAQRIRANSDGVLWTDGTGPTFTQWLDDMAILDFMGMGPLALGTVKTGQKGAMSAFRRLTQAAPDAATKLAVEALTNPAARAKLGNLLGEDIAEVMLPAAMKGAEEAGVNGMGALMARAQRAQEEIRLTLVEGAGVTAATRRAFEQELKTILGQTTNNTIHLDKSVFELTDSGVDYVARVGRTASKGYNTVAAARKALADFPLPDAKLVKLENGKFVEVADDVKSGKGQFFIQHTDSRTYDSSRSVWDSMLFDRAQVRDLHLPSNVAPLSKLWNWFLPTGSMFGKGVAEDIAAVAMRAPVVQKLHQGMVDTLMHLGKDDQRVVSTLLKLGEEKGTVLTVEQIRTLFPKAEDAVVTAYYEARTMADAMHTLANSQQRTEWFRAGVKDIVAKDGHVGFGKVLPSATDAVNDIRPGYAGLHVFNPDTGEFLKMSRAEIDGLYASGGRLSRMEDLIEGKGFKEATHVLMTPTTRVMELPRHVLPKIPGYYPHIFQGTHVVYGVSKAGNKVALAVAKTAGDARAEVARIGRVMDRMAKAGKERPYEQIDFQFDRSLRDPLVVDKSSSDPIFGATSKVYGTRSGRMLRNASKLHGDHMVDPIEALLRGMELVSHSVTKGNLIKHMEQRLTNTLKLMERETGARIIKDPRNVVKTPDDINYVSKAAKDHRKALSYMQQIDMIRRIPDAVERHMAVALATAESVLDTFAEKIAKLPLPGAKSVAADLDRLGGKLVDRAAKGVDPMRLGTEFAHRVYIAANPVQQFALQLSQALMLTGLAPRDLPLAISRTVPVHTLLHARIMFNTSDKLSQEWYKRTLKTAAKLSGMAEDELEKLVGVLERTGLVDTVSMHSQMRTAARTQAHSRMLASASTLNAGAPQRVTMEVLEKLDEVSFGLLSKIGFEAGEQYNRVATFLTLYQRDKRAGIANLGDSEYIRKLTSEANELVGSMLRETSMGYQRGWLKAAFQFSAFQHKMAALMLTSKQFSPWQRTKFALAQFFLFGSRGAFHMDAAHRAFENWIVEYESQNQDEKNKMLDLYWHPTTQSMLDGIVFDMGVNTLIRTVYGDDAPGFAWNRRLAPGGGTEMLAQTIIDLRNKPQEKVLGLAGEHGSKVWQFAKHVERVMLARSKDMDDVPAAERYKMLVKEGGALAFSGYDKYLAAAAVQSMGGWVTDTGNIFADTDTGLERFLAVTLGVNTEDREAYYDATDKLYRDVRNDPKRHQETLRKLANEMFRRHVDETVKFSSEAPTPEAYDLMESKAIRERAMLLSFLEPWEQEQVSRMVGDQIAELIRNRNTPAQQAFYDKLTRHIANSGIGEDEALNWGTYMERSPLFQTYPQLQSDFLQKIREISEYEDK